jgi:hypothetical protein
VKRPDQRENHGRCKVKRFLAVVLAVVIAAACAHAAGAPDWVSGKGSPKYPPNKFITGIGQGDDLQKAQDRARAEIAKLFSVKVEQVVNTFQQYTDSDGAKGKSWLSSSSTNEITKTTVAETLQGVEIRETWVDTKYKVHYALAVLPRSAAEARISEAIMDLDSKIKSSLANAAGARDKIQKIRHLMRAFELYKERQGKNGQLSIVSLEGEGIKPSAEVAGTYDALNDELSKLTVSIEIKGDLSAAVTEAITSSLASSRINVKPQDKSTDISVTGKAESLEPESSSIGFVFARAKAFASIVNVADGKTFGTVEKEIREGAKDMQGARISMISSLKEEMLKEFNAKFRAALSPDPRLQP